MKDTEKPFLDHLEDLRWLILKCAGAIGIGAVLGVSGIGMVMQIIRRPLMLAEAGQGGGALLALQVTDPMTVTLQIGMGAGVLLALPVLLYFVGDYLLPALDPKERRLLLPAFLAGAFLFLAGVAFCYFLVLPQALAFFREFNQWLGLQTSWTMASYTDFVLQMLVGFGLSFELPLIMVILAWLGLLSRSVATAHRRHAVVILLVVAACVTPTSDPFNLALMFFPLYGLFEFGLLGMGWAERKAALSNQPRLS